MARHASSQRFWLVCYDIRCDKRLRKVAKAMERHGARVQKSVFECWLTSADLQTMLAQVEREMDQTVDSLRLYPLCKPCREAAEKAGKTEIREIQQYYIS